MLCLQLSFDHLKYSLEVYRRHLSNWSNVTVTINSAVNFIVYCVVSRQFRVDLIRMLSCGTRSGSPTSNGRILSQPRRRRSLCGSSNWLYKYKYKYKYKSTSTRVQVQVQVQEYKSTRVQVQVQVLGTSYSHKVYYDHYFPRQKIRAIELVYGFELVLVSVDVGTI